VQVHDKDVTEANIIGANREYVDREIPHLWALMRPSIEEVIEESDVIVIGNASQAYRRLSSALDGRIVIDLARAIGGKRSGTGYQGICW
jgi:GDP-mannose 6-dehydrogenase